MRRTAASALTAWQAEAIGGSGAHRINGDAVVDPISIRLDGAL